MRDFMPTWFSLLRYLYSSQCAGFRAVPCPCGDSWDSFSFGSWPQPQRATSCWPFIHLQAPICYKRSSNASLMRGQTPAYLRQGQKLLRVDFDTSAGDETYTTLKASLEMAKQFTKLLAEALICGKEGAEPTGEAFCPSMLEVFIAK